METEKQVRISHDNPAIGVRAIEIPLYVVVEACLGFS